MNYKYIIDMYYKIKVMFDIRKSVDTENMLKNISYF